ncbi:MAG TPA: DegQ family serine endoprotease [Plasticicumulans sp.]|nr:DegQ family serine endoprotease [Plasticicumulans sp.]
MNPQNPQDPNLPQSPQASQNPQTPPAATVPPVARFARARHGAGHRRGLALESTGLRRSLLAAALVAAFGAGAVVLGGSELIEQAHAEAPAVTPAPARIVTPDFGALVERYGPAVVNIQVEGTVRTAAQQPQIQIDPNDPLYDFLRRFGLPGLRGRGGPAPDVVRGEGSGFIVRADGVILTNTHVVDGAEHVTVRLTDRREFKARVLGKDDQSDIAVLKIDASDLPTVRIGDPARSRVGDWVLAIGSPFGFENSVSAGIVSAKARTLPDDNYVPFLQTDVAVNPGNSGGPLFNADGEVIGVNSQIYSRTGGYQGISFAIPIDVAMKVEQQIVAHGKVTRGRLGVAIQDVSAPLAAAFGLKTPHGALVSSVEPGSAGEAAGLEAGDVIVALDGQTIERSADLPPRIADSKPGSHVELTVIRKGEEKTLKATVGEFRAAAREAGDEVAPGQGRLGLALRPLSPQEKRGNDLDSGLLVQQASGPAARAGVAPGDVVLAINGEPVNTVAQLKERLAHAGKQIALLIQRGEARIFVPVDLG